MSIKGLKDTIDWYDEHAEQYATASAPNLNMGHINAFVELLPKNAKVLDVGCGAGRDAQPLKQKGLDVVGLDLSVGLLKVARREFPGIDFVEGNMLALPFDDAQFDGIWSNASLLHLETIDDVKLALSEMHRTLKANGILYVLVKAQTGAHKTAVVSDKLSSHDRFFQYFSVDELKRLLAEGRFELVDIKEYSEVETNPHGRPEVKLIWCLARRSK